MVQAEQVWKFFGHYPALRNISLSVERGECLALLGRNGAGKTTLLQLLAGLSRPGKGRVLVEGRDVRHPASRARLGLLGHGIGLYEELSARENLRLFAELYNVPRPRDVAQTWLERTWLSTVAEAPVREFSRGMRQRLAIARALLHQPDLVLLDEPFTSLDDRAVALLQQVLREALERGSTLIMSTHQVREAMELTTQVALLQRGELRFAGPRPAEMLQDAGWLYRHYGEPV